MRRVVIAVLLGLGVAIAGTGTAGAHAEIIRSDPAADETIGTGTDEVSMTLLSFDASEPVTVSVTNADGEEFAAGAPDVSTIDSVVTQAVTPLDAGTYTYTWNAMSSDGDGPATGTFTFTVKDVGSGIAMYVIWAVALAIPAAIFFRPGARRRGGEGGPPNKELV